MRIFSYALVRRICCSAIFTLILAENADAQFVPLTTAQITSYTTAALPACSQWRVIGVCIWLTCTNVACNVETEPQFGHYNPDVVVSSYDHALENPWVEMQPVLEAYNAAFTAALGNIATDGGHTTDQANDGQGIMRLKYADVVGNPALGMLDFGGYSCESTADALTPYFTSTSDVVAWRLIDPVGGLEAMTHPYALAYPTPGVPRALHRNVTSSPVVVPFVGADWGSTYPRTGFVRQMHEYKAAAVIATKAAAVVTDPAPMIWGHIAQSIAFSVSDQMRWLPPEIESGNPATAMWQQLYPYMEATCAVFPDIDDFTGPALAAPVDPWVHRISETGNYAWNLWRPYSCCDRPANAVSLIAATGVFP